MRFLASLMLLTLLALPARAADEQPPVRAVRTDRPVIIDGQLDEDIWKHEHAVTNLLQQDPDQGGAPRQRSEVRLAYDDDALYVGARLYDSAPDSLRVRLSRRDNDAGSDMFALMVDPFHDKRTGYYFMVSAAGTLMDGVLLNDGWDDDSWDGVWQARSKRDAQGWTCEMRIPFSQMRFRSAEPMVWGVNFKRWIPRYSEEDALVYTPRGEAGFVSRFPELQGLDGLQARQHIELTPYVTNKTEHLRFDGNSLQGYGGGDPFHGGWKAKPAVGGDLRMSLGTKLTLNATVNPDFGQVEIDPAVVNLSDVENFFQEKRPFFTEGVSVFRCGNNGANDYSNFNWPEPIFFYSRRIGRGPQGTRGLPNSDYLDLPTATHILGAAKITGQPAPGWNVGTVQALTNREEATLRTAGLESRYGVEPMSYYGVWRGMHEMNDRRQGLGLMAMTTAHFFDSGTDPLRTELNRNSVVTAMDGWTFLDKDRIWVISGYGMASRVEGSPARIARLQRSFPHYYQRPDRPGLGVDPTATTMAGYGGRLWLNKQKGKVIFNAGLGAISPGFDNNDLGFLFGGDIVNGHVLAGYQWNEPKGWRQYANLFGAVASSWDFGGNSTMKMLFLGGNIEQRNHWSWSHSAFYNGEAFSARKTRGGPLMLTKPGGSLSLGFDTNSRNPWFWEVNTNPSWSADGSWEQQVNPGIRWRPMPNLSLSGGPDFYRGHTDTQYMRDSTGSVGTGSQFAQLEQTQWSMNLRADYAMTTNLSIQLFVQPLISTLRFHDFKELGRSRSYDLIAMPEPSPGYLAERSGTFGSLRGNAVVRWEYGPGSSVFFVWTQESANIDALSDFDPSRAFRVISKAPANNVFLIKVAHHFDI
ncbi:MAG: DUF5916 domain-containing protein [Candidatus Eisenbacteria bacterium]